jgi:16S rRNA processing protein RimM
MTNNLIYIAQITKPHGIKGDAKLFSHTDNPKDIFTYPDIYDENMKKYHIKYKSGKANPFIISVNGNESRNFIEEIAGIKLYITKDMLPPPKENEYYHIDLKDIEVFDSKNKSYGKIIDVHNFGAGEIIEVESPKHKDTVYLPFSKEFVIETNIKKKSMIFDFEKYPF